MDSLQARETVERCGCMTRLPALLLLALLAPPATALAASTDAPEIRLKAPDGTALAEQVVRVSCGDGIEHVFVADKDGRIPLPSRASEARCTVVVDHSSGRLTMALEPGASETVLRAKRPALITAGGEPRTVSMDEFRSIPVGESAGRDFTMVVEASATASRDSAGISLAGTTSVETTYSIDGMPVTLGSQGPVAGTLTAGAVDDVRSARSYFEFLETLQHPNAARFKAERRRIVRVVDDRGTPIGGATVTVGGRSFRTRRDGRVVLVPGWDGIEDNDRVRVVSGRDQRVVPLEETRRGSEQDVVLPRPQRQEPAAKLDLVLVLDTTGSMGDELEYLKTEMDALLSRLHRKHASLEVRWGLVVYRDEGDDYVARVHPFTDDFETFRASLGRQSAGRGGDAPEAVHSAFAAAEQIRWRDAAVSSRVLLHLADAPAHRDKTLQALRAADRLRLQGTAIYPIAASGVDQDAEFTMRTMAMFSGGQYVFLTDDSGVGNPHREASAACFKVEPLIDVMSKILDAEIAGQRPSLPRGDRGSGCPGKQRPLARTVTPGPRRAARHPLEYSLMDDDALTDFLGQPRTRHLLP